MTGADWASLVCTLLGWVVAYQVALHSHERQSPLLWGGVAGALFIVAGLALSGRVPDLWALIPSFFPAYAWAFPAAWLGKWRRNRKNIGPPID